MMGHLSWLLLISYLHCTHFKDVIAQYHWNCSEPDEKGERYIPGVREYPSDVLTDAINGGEIHMHRVQNLTDGCHGEVTAIEYCYRYYHSPELGDAAFNWTVLFFIEEGERLKITRIDNIESRPNSLPKSDCQIDIPGTVKCCNREIITSFDLGPHMNGFIFGVTEAAHGNTRNAALVGFHSSLLEYNIDTMIVSKAGLQNNISVGYTLPRTSGGQTLGLQMMWFVIENTPTARSTSPSRDIDGVTTLSPISDSTESGTFQPPEALAATSTSAISTSSDSNVNRISRAQTNVGVVVGSVIGTVLPVTILLSVVAILTLALAQLARKYKSIVRRQGFRNPAAHNAYTVDVEMKSNEAYQSQFRSRLDSMESNAAYGGATVHQEAGNNLYETIRSFEISHEDNIAQACDRSTEQVKNETDDFTGSTVYEYIEEDDR